MVDEELNTEHPAEKDRYHLYINLGCPWSMSAYTALYLKGL
jgi:putative glutathione S-transferase